MYDTNIFKISFLALAIPSTYGQQIFSNFGFKNYDLNKINQINSSIS